MRGRTAELLYRSLTRFLCDERGTTAIEYGLIATLMGVGIIGGLNALGNSSNGGWGNMANTVGKALH